MRNKTTLALVLAILIARSPSASLAGYIGWGVATNTVAKSTDGGLTWTNFASNAGFSPGVGHFHPELYAVTSPDPNDVWIAGDTGLIMHSANGGNSWTIQSDPTSQRISRLRFVDANNGWAVGLSGSIVHTADGGAHWSGQASGTANSLYAVAATDAQNAWTVGDSGTILHTSNGGVTWTSQNSGTIQQLTGIAFSDSLNGWAVGFGQTFLQTSNGGQTWQSRVGAFGPWDGGFNGTWDLHIFDPNHLWVVGDLGLGYSADAGNTWSTFVTDQGSLSGPVDFVNPQTGWTNDQGVLWLTTDSGNTWTRHNSGFGFNDITFQDPNASPAPEPSYLALLLSAPLLLCRRPRPPRLRHQ